MSVDPFITYAVKTIGDLLIDEAKFLYGVKGKAEELQSELSRLQWFLEDAEKKTTEKDRFQQWIFEAREMAFAAEDFLEGYAFKVASTRDAGLAYVVVRRSIFILNDCYRRHKTASKLKSLLQKASKLQNSLQAYGVRDVIENEGSSLRPQLLRRTYSFVEEDDFVGLEDDVDLLVKHLVGTDDQNIANHRVVSIFGMGGLGKTTLARKVYNHPSAKRHFSRLVWICLSQQWQAKDLLQRIMIRLVPEKKKEIEMYWREEELIRELWEIQQQMKCLIVLDDIWTTDVWESIKNAFPMRQAVGSKILLTTRIRDVALHIDPDGFHHQPRLLNEDESWNLLRRKSLRQRSNAGHIMSTNQNELEELGRKMATCCGGLPLAVVVLGGILLARNNVSEWQAVHQDIKAYIFKGKTIGKEGELQRILALSYYDLPSQLKPCFLYLGSFADDAEIPVDTLYQMWIAEVLGGIGQRGMVQLQTSELPGIRGFRSCRLHDLMRDFCLLQADAESFLNYIRYSSEGNDSYEPYGSLNESSICKLRRLAISLGPDQYIYVSPKKEIAKYLRMFQLAGNKKLYARAIIESINSQLNCCVVLRVLSLEGLHQEATNKLPKAIGKLVHLRYMSLRDSYFQSLPSSLGKLKHLQTLDLRLGNQSWRLPNVFWKMTGLTYLYLPHGRYYMQSNRLRLDGLNKCEKFENLELIANHVQRSNKLQQVSIHNHCDSSSMSGGKGVKVLKQLFFGRNVYCLSTSVALWKESPELESNNMLSSLVELEVNYGGLDAEETICETVEKFSHLRKLTLIGLRRKEMIFNAGGFPQLRILELWKFENLERWVVEKDAMPHLRTLWISRWPALNAIPDGLKFVTTLETLNIDTMAPNFRERIRTSENQEGEDFHKISHVPLIRYDHNPL
ncbi:OLC1v1019629C1 [Oldenlandia corymbosa var. corymbosa]|uniref:OLC1v1019629C1 n=1 Tax=Oldenlandia corymbosa var. corymbosa TaxID=529605 RepID=A0AAV1EEE8_OLDCO|nr:OLC1v1019629C1 [Oldenlandia corymbosa var. corymbosa]